MLVIKSSGGGSLATCNGSKSQHWDIRGGSSKQQLVSGANGLCVSRHTTTAYNITTTAYNIASHDGSSNSTTTNGREETNGIATEMEFDVAKQLGAGWEKGAKVRDLWLHSNLGTASTIKVQLDGNGDSRMFKLSKLTS